MTVWVCAAAMAGLVGLAASCSDESHMSAVSGEQFPSDRACAKCHVEIAREFAASPHATAYTNPRYREATDDYRFAGCIGCHAPEPRYRPGEPRPRSVNREAGVTCVSCHFEEDKMVGPLDPTGLVAPHPVKVLGARYRNAAFCGRCHQGTYAQWLSAGDPNRTPACQRCHMPPITRKMTQATSEISKIFVATEKAEPQRSHSFTPVPAQAAEAIAAKLVRGAGGVELIVQNLMPHALPTGDFGSHRLLLTVEAVTAASGGVSTTTAPATATVISRWELTSAAGKAIPVGEQVRLPLELPAGAKTIRVRLDRPGPQASPAQRTSMKQNAATIFSALIEIPEAQ